MIPFSVRHRIALTNKKIDFKIPVPVRRKIFYCMQDWDVDYGYEGEYSILYNRLEWNLLKNYGEKKLHAYVNDKWRTTVSIEEFILGTKPECVLDAVENFCDLLDEYDESGKCAHFQKECNQIFKTENLPLVIHDGSCLVLDSYFMESEILNKAYELLKERHFEKAIRDFLNARNNFTAGDYSGTIIEANNAIESALKKILHDKKAKQKKLKNSLMKSELIPNYFQGFCDSFENLLQSAFTIANESRHGKEDIPTGKNEVDYAVASFMLNLTGTLLVFIMERCREHEEEIDTPF